MAKMWHTAGHKQGPILLVGMKLRSAGQKDLGKAFTSSSHDPCASEACCQLRLLPKAGQGKRRTCTQPTADPAQESVSVGLGLLAYMVVHT